jgi:hypothetical protein
VSEKYIAIQLVARFAPSTLEEREALEDKIIALLGCNGAEADCPMVLYASTVVDDAETASNWLH